MDTNEIGSERKIFTITLNKEWSTPFNLFKKEYKIISEIKETEEGFECDIEEV